MNKKKIRKVANVLLLVISLGVLGWAAILFIVNFLEGDSEFLEKDGVYIYY